MALKFTVHVYSQGFISYRGWGPLEFPPSPQQLNNPVEDVIALPLLVCSMGASSCGSIYFQSFIKGHRKSGVISIKHSRDNYN